MKKLTVFFLILMCFSVAGMAAEEAYLSDCSVQKIDEYHKLMFAEDFEETVNLRKRTDMWSFAGAEPTVENGGADHEKAACFPAQIGKSMYMKPEIMEPDYAEPSEEKALPLQKLRFICDVKLDEGANVMLRCKTYDSTEDIILLQLNGGNMLLFGKKANVIGTYDSEWHTYCIEVDAVSGEVSVYVDTNKIADNEKYDSLERNIPGVMAFGVTAANTAEESYIYVDNMKVYSASAQPQIETDGINEGEVSYVLLPQSKGSVLCAAVYKDNKLCEVKTVSSDTKDYYQRLSLKYSMEHNMTVKAFCFDTASSLTPITEKTSANALTEADCDAILAAWRYILVGDENNSWTNSYAQSDIKEINNTAKTVLNRMNTQPDATVLFGTTEVLTTADMSDQYRDMYRMALAYGTYGAKLYKDEELKEKILYAMDWLYEHYYGEDEINGTGWMSMEDYNWYDWFSTTPEYLMKTMIILGDGILAEEIEKYTSPYRYMHAWESKGNDVGSYTSRLANSTMFAVLTYDTELLYENIEHIHQVLPVVKKGDGYREDGMFIYHTRYPYTGVYGINTLVGTILPVEQVLSSSKGAFSDIERNYLLRHIKETYEPAIYRGRMMVMLMGRLLDGTEERYEGLQVIRALDMMLDLYDGEEREFLEQVIRRNIPDTAEREYYLGAIPAASVDTFNEILSEDFPEDLYEVCKVYYSGDRVIQQRNGYAVGLAMSSERVPAYESINSANKKGWFTGDGVLYIYSAGGYENQYTPTYWSNVNMARLPGTTEDTRERKTISVNNTNAYVPPFSFVGGAEYNRKFAVATMDFKGFNNPVVPSTDADGGHGGELEYFVSTLEAKKAWFMFDDEIVALGAGIISRDNAEVNTYITNFMLKGTEKITQKKNFLHLERFGGIYLPQEDEYITNITGGDNSFFEMWIPHGVNPENKTYAYVILPDKGLEDTESYAQSSDVEILSNTDAVQAIREKTLGITGIVFHEATTFSGITVDNPVVLLYDGETVKVADPTHKLDGVTVTVDGKQLRFDLSNKKGETLTKSLR